MTGSRAREDASGEDANDGREVTCPVYDGVGLCRDSACLTACKNGRNHHLEWCDVHGWAPADAGCRCLDCDTDCHFCDDGLAIVGDQFVPCPACNALSVAMEIRDPHLCRWCPHDTYGKGLG